MPLPAGFWAPQKTGSIGPTRGWAHFYKAPASLQWAHFSAGPEISFRGATTLHIFSENFPNFLKKREYIDLSSGLKKMYFVKILSRIHTNIYKTDIVVVTPVLMHQVLGLDRLACPSRTCTSYVFTGGILSSFCRIRPLWPDPELFSFSSEYWIRPHIYKASVFFFDLGIISINWQIR